MSSTADVRWAKGGRAYSCFCPSVTAGGDGGEVLDRARNPPDGRLQLARMIQTLFDSPCAISGSVWRYWYASSSASASPRGWR